MDLTTGEHITPTHLTCPVCNQPWACTIVPVAPMSEDDEEGIALIVDRDPAHAACAQSMNIETLGAVD